MKDNFVRESEIIEKNEKERNDELMQNVFKAKQDLVNATMNFETAEKDLVDYYVYEIKASQAKLDYLIKKAKRRGLIGYI